MPDKKADHQNKKQSRPRLRKKNIASHQPGSKGEAASTPLPASTLSSIKDGDLYALLSVCNDDDLAPLVEVITRQLTNSLEGTDEFKKHHPRHSKYYRTIGDEIRLFGGNSLRSHLIRGGVGPSYDEIVLDVCTKLDIPQEKGNTLKNENNLLTIYFDRQWKSLTDEEKEIVMAEARKTASDQLSTTKAVAKTYVLFALTRLHPIGWGALAIDIAGPAFRVTVPCILHVAYLRKKIVEGQADAAGSLVDAPVLVPPDPTSTGQRKAKRSAPLVIGDSGDAHFLSLTQISDPGLRQWNSVGGEDSGISRLNPLLQAVPSLATAQNVASTNYMEVVINGPLLKAKGKDGYRLITMIDNKPSHGTLLAPSKLSNIVNAAVLLQIASVVVAQKHLADISRKLDDIKTTMNRIERFQIMERRSVLTGAVHYMKQVAQSVVDGEWSDSVRNQIEAHEAKLLEVQHCLTSAPLGHIEVFA